MHIKFYRNRSVGRARSNTYTYNNNNNRNANVRRPVTDEDAPRLRRTFRIIIFYLIRLSD